MANRTDDRRRFFEDETALTQDVLDECSLYGLINIAPTAFVGKFTVDDFLLYVSDRPVQEQYNGDSTPIYYEGRAEIKPVMRTLGELLNPSVQFANAEIKIMNIDGFYNAFLETGANYTSPINSLIQVSMALSHKINDADRINMFVGFTSKDEPLVVEKDALTFRGPDRLSVMDVPPDLPVINETDFPSAPEDSFGKVIPFVLGDWEDGYNFTAATGEVTINDTGTPQQAIVDSPTNFYGGIIGYNVGGGLFVFSIGTYTPDNISNAHIKRGDIFLAINFTAAPSNTSGYWSIQVTSIKKVGGGTIPYVYQSGDVATIAVKVPYSAGEYSNIVSIAKEMIITLSEFDAGNFDDTTWDHFAAKTPPPSESAVSVIEARVWIGDNNETVLRKVLGVLEQMRLELYMEFPAVGTGIALTSLHPDEWPAPGDDFSIDQFDIDEESFQIQTDDRNFFNKAAMNYAFTPVTGKTQLTTAVMSNDNSIALAEKEVYKIIDCPCFYTSDAQTQLGEFLRLYSAGLSYINLRTSWVHMKRELGQVGGITFQIGSIDLNNTPALIRDISIDPKTGAVSMKLLNLATFAYQNYTPSNADKCLSAYDEALTLYI